MTRFAALVMTAFAMRVAAGQAPPAFEAASVKLNTSGGWRREIGPTPGGRFTATNTPARDLIAFAYGVSQDGVSFRIVGGPKWIDEDRFNVVATVTGQWTFQQMREMVRTLLADRFRLAAHTDTRELPTYALVVVQSQPLRKRKNQPRHHHGPRRLDVLARFIARSIRQPVGVRSHAAHRSL